VYLPNDVQTRRKVQAEAANVTDDVQKKCIEIGGIACTEDATP